jgi:CRP/FNR family transcriptional regulator
MLIEATTSEIQLRHPTPARPQFRHPLGLEDYLARAVPRRLDTHEHLFCEGDQRTHIYRVESGALSLYRVLQNGRRQVVGFAYPGDLVGLGVAERHVFAAEASAATVVKGVSVGQINQIAAEDPLFAMRLYETLSGELALAREMLVTIGRRDAAERVATFLLALSRRNARVGRDASLILLPMTRSDIADFLGLTTETVSRTITKLTTGRIIDRDQRHAIRLLDTDGLEAVAAGERRV